MTTGGRTSLITDGPSRSVTLAHCRHSPLFLYWSILFYLFFFFITRSYVSMFFLVMSVELRLPLYSFPDYLFRWLEHSNRWLRYSRVLLRAKSKKVENGWQPDPTYYEVRALDGAAARGGIYELFLTRLNLSCLFLFYIILSSLQLSESDLRYNFFL